MIFLLAHLLITLACDLCEICETSVGCSSCLPNSSMRDDRKIDCSCDTMYYRESSTSCLKCPELCYNCMNSTYCTECHRSSVLINNSCVCPDGFYFDTSSNYCLSCISNCKTCSNGSSCLSCKENMVLKNDLCECETRFFLNSTSCKCEKCGPDCYTCESFDYCLTCGEFSDLGNGKCQCRDGYFLKNNDFCEKCPETCKTCSSELICDECAFSNSYPDVTSEKARCLCVEGFFLCDNTCVQCHETCNKCSETVCSDCKDLHATPDFSKADGSCRCLDGYYLGSAGCDQCHASCRTCNETNCFSCVSPKAEVSGKICECSSGYYNHSQTECLSCDISCAKCNRSACLACFNDMAEISKKQCRCPLGTFTNNFHRSCFPCESNCSNCLSLKNCLTCKDSNSEPVKGVCTCKSGYYLVSGTCIKCDISCNTCDANSNCLSCKDANSYISKSKTCECNPGYFKSDICRSCHSSCLSCSSSECFECSFNNSKKILNRCECLDGYFLENNSCHPCDEKCETCNLSTCITCIDFAELKNGKCECLDNREIFNGTCRCADGFVGSEDCLKCWRFLGEEDVEVYFDEGRFSFEIYFLVEILEVGSFGCKDIFLGDSLMFLAPNSTCYWSLEDEGIIVLIDPWTNFTGQFLELNPFRFLGTENLCLTSPKKLLIPILSYCQENITVMNTKLGLTIIGPESVSSSCKTNVSYSAVTNSGSKNAKSISWSTSPVVPKIEVGQMVTFDISSIKEKKLVITAIQINKFGENSTSQVVLDVVEERVLEVVVKNGRYFTTKRSEELTVVAMILNDCGTGGDETWNWTLVSSTGKDEGIGNLSNFWNENTLVLPSFTLKYQINYTFSVRVEKDEVVGETLFYLYVEPQDLVIKINRGSGSISRYVDTILNASDSFDPDGENLSYSWTFTNYQDSENNSKNFYIIKSQYIKNISSIEVNLEISTKSKRKSIQLLLYPSNLNISLEYEITSQRLNLPQTFFVLLNSNFDSKLFWKDSSNKILSKTTLLTIKSLNQEETFKFTISQNSSEFFGYIKVTPNQPAVCSELVLSHQTLKSFEEPLETTANNCYDQDESDYPLTYSFSTSNSGNYTKILSNSLLSHNIFYLFPGKYRLLLTVCDSLQSCSQLKSSEIFVEKSNFSDPSLIFHKLKNNPTEAVVIAGKVGKLSDDLTSEMWKELKKGKPSDQQELESLLSAMLVLAKDKNFNFKEFLKLLKTAKLDFSEKSMDLIFAIQDQLIQNGLKINDVFKLNKFLEKALKGAKNTLEVGQKYEKKMKNLKIFKSCYVDDPLGPDSISNLPVSDSGNILNFQFISYSTPSDAYSLLFTVSGKKVKNFQSKHAEEEVFFEDLKILLTVELSNKSRPVCIYSNETGDYKSDGCSIFSSNSTHTTLEITHTSFFYLDFLVDSDTSSSSCEKNYSPCYILNFLVIGCPLLAIIFKVTRKTEKEQEEQAGLNEEVKEICDVPIKIPTDENFNLKNMSMIYFHLYIGVYINGRFYLSSLKIFVILCSLVSNLFFIGLFLVNIENIDNNDSKSFLSFIHYSCISFVLTLPVQAFLHFTFTRPRTFHGYILAGGFACGLVFVLVTSIHIIMYNYSMCEEWAKLWSILFSLTVLYEFAFHSLAMFFLYAIRARLSKSRFF